MIAEKDIKKIVSSLKDDGINITVSDIAYLVLCDTLGTQYAKEATYGNGKVTAKTKLDKLSEQLKPFGIGIASSLTMEMNKESLVQRLAEIEEAKSTGTIDLKDAFKLELDYRTKLQDKFNVEAAEGERRIIMLPNKHDMVCPHTHRECTYMPTKEACMKYYNLKEK